jgi:hypothetical protein
MRYMWWFCRLWLMDVLLVVDGCLPWLAACCGWLLGDAENCGGCTRAQVLVLVLPFF